MTLQEKIEKAFAHRKMPIHAVDPDYVKMYPGDSDIEDALTFNGKNWREITRDHWIKYNCAFGFLSDDAFGYYLPSLLVIPLVHPLNHMDMAIDRVVHALDRTPPVTPEDFPFECRLAGLTYDEYETIKEWLLFMSENYPDLAWGAAKGGPGDLYGRAFDTIAVLQNG